MNEKQRVALNRGVPSLPVLMLISAGFLFTSVFVIVAWIRDRESFWWLFACVTISFTWLLYRERSRQGQYDWDRVAFLEWHDGNIIFVPDRRMRSFGYMPAEAPFPVGAYVEYHVQTGDRYFTGDHSQFLQSSLWIVGPTGTKQKLLDFAAGLSLKTMAINLSNASIPFRIIKVYDGEKGEHTETDVTAERIQASTKAGKKGLVDVLIGTSSLWLGALAGALVHNGGYVIAIGVLGYAAIAIATIAMPTPTKIAKRTALIQLVTLIPSYAGGYAMAAILVRHMFHR